MGSQWHLVQRRGALWEGGAASQEFKELKEMLKQQQNQINQLTQSIAALQGPSKRVGFSRDSLICRRCQRPGHYTRDCEGERVVRQLQTPPVTRPPLDVQPARSGQPSGNGCPPV